MTNAFQAGTRPVAFLVCFAVRQEAAYFRKQETGSGRQVEVRITGMGPRNAWEGVLDAIAALAPERVLTCGFAGGLHPELTPGTIVFDEDPGMKLAQKLRGLGAVPGQFHCASKVVVTAEEKRRLRSATGADAVEMESEVIRRACRERAIPSATVRVISDGADQDLPLDFNVLMTSAHRIHFGRLACSLLKRPQRILRLLAFQREVDRAARRLGEVLTKLVTG